MGWIGPRRNRREVAGPAAGPMGPMHGRTREPDTGKLHRSLDITNYPRIIPWYGLNITMCGVIERMNPPVGCVVEEITRL